MIKKYTDSRLSARRENYLRVLSVLPEGISREIEEIARSVGGIESGLSEVRVRAEGLSSVFIHSAVYPLFYRVSRGEMELLVGRLTGGALYAHKGTVARGYIIYEGIRVGVSGLARYDGEELAVSDVSSLVFRLGGGECSFGEELLRSYRKIKMPNMLVAAPPAGGKTTALRSLARGIGSGRDAMHVVVVDERCEFDAREYASCDVDILRGYRRQTGIELAFRTMSAEVIIVDEITTRGEALALLYAHGAGVRLISSVHAKELSDVYKRECLSPLLEAGVFGAVTVISRIGGRFTYRIEEV